MTKDEIIEYLYENHVHADLKVEEIAEDLEEPKIIRCKDCKHRYIENMIWHCPFGLMGGENFFCGYGSLGTEEVKGLPSAEPEISRIEQELHGKTPEEQYEFIYWLLFKSFEATAYSNSRLAIIDWLKGDKGNG